jgi:hypothetical protein
MKKKRTRKKPTPSEKLTALHLANRQRTDESERNCSARSKRKPARKDLRKLIKNLGLNPTEDPIVKELHAHTVHDGESIRCGGGRMVTYKNVDHHD